MQKYRADSSKPQADGAILWFANWLGGPTLAKIKNCRLNLAGGDWRRTVYITGEPNTFFSTPAVCKIRGCRIKGYVTVDNDGLLMFRHVYYN